MMHAVEIGGHSRTSMATELELLILCSSVLDHEYDAPIPQAGRVLRAAKDLGLVRRNELYQFDEGEEDIMTDDQRPNVCSLPLTLTLLGNEWLRSRGWM